MVFSSAAFLFGFLPFFLLGAWFTSRLGLTARNLNLVIFSLAFYTFGAGLYTAILLAAGQVRVIDTRPLLEQAERFSPLF